MKKETITVARPRAYRQTARAEAAAATARRILDAAFARFSTMTFDEVTLANVAADAGVTEQTVIRRFGSKEELFEAVVERELPRVEEDREPVDADRTLDAAIGALVRHYEKDGRTMLSFLSYEARSPAIASLLRRGRELHARWVERHCAAAVGTARGPERERRLNAAIAATDLYTWKLMRLDRGLEPREVEGVMMALLRGLERTTGGNR